MHTLITTDISKAVASITKGRIVAFPTGTSYGLAADTQQGFALQRLRNIKQRPGEKTFTISMKEELWPTFLDMSKIEKEAVETLRGLAVTILLRPQPNLYHLAQDGLVGLRMIDNRLMKNFLDAVNVPVTATSANISGQPACFSAQAVEQVFTGKRDETTYDLSVGAILDGGQLPNVASSTIIQFDTARQKISIKRPGVVTPTVLAQLLPNYTIA